MHMSELYYVSLDFITLHNSEQPLLRSQSAALAGFSNMLNALTSMVGTDYC